MNIRKSRLADEIRDILGSSLMGGRLEDPRLQGVTVTAVKLSADLQVATVYFTILGEQHPDQRDVAVSGLESASGLFRHMLADSLKLRRVPSLRFFFDRV